MSSERLSLREAADELGLHYMTVYRYVRTGLLPATKDGGMWWVKLADLGNLQVSPSAEVGRGKRDLARLVPRLVNALVSGDESGVWRIADSQKQAGCGIEEFCIDLLVPAMDKIGNEWQEGSRSIADEHRASALVPSLLGRLRTTPRPSGRKRGLVIVGCPPTEEHSIPASIFEELLRGRRFEVQNLGANTPPFSFVDVCADADRLLAVAFSVSVATSLEGLRTCVDELRSAGFGEPMIVGGIAVVGLSAGELGVDHVVSGFREGLDLIETLVGS